jgi:hypothetical protein
MSEKKIDATLLEILTSKDVWISRTSSSSIASAREMVKMSRRQVFQPGMWCASSKREWSLDTASLVLPGSSEFCALEATGMIQTYRRNRVSAWIRAI